MSIQYILAGGGYDVKTLPGVDHRAYNPVNVLGQASGERHRIRPQPLHTGQVRPHHQLAPIEATELGCLHVLRQHVVSQPPPNGGARMGLEAKRISLYVGREGI